MALDPNDLAAPILEAIEPVLSKYWGDVKEYAETEAQKMATTLASITKLRRADRINNQQAQALLEMQKHAMQAVLLAVEGIGLVAAQNAVNAGLAAVKDTVNRAMGFVLL